MTGPSMPGSPEIPCHLCGAPGLSRLPGYETFHRVTSDCRPWKSGGQLGVCPACATVQKPIDPAWREEADEIYASYALYHQSADASEQRTFDQSSGAATPRSTKIFESLFTQETLSPTGRMLDVGCGIGVTLDAFARYAPGWKLFGVDPNLKESKAVARIDHVEAVYGCELAEVPGRYDLITVMHVLEHVVDPARLLSDIRDRLADGGRLLIQVPHFPDNPFDLLIADHCSHFTAETVRPLLDAAGLEIVMLETTTIARELTVLARRGAVLSADIDAEVAERNRLLTVSGQAWLHETLEAARAAARNGRFGVFGTSIAANWLYAEIEEAIEFFVDEDPTRAGTRLHGRPVLDPKDVPAGAHVFLCLTPELASRIAGRLPATGAVYHLPPTKHPE